VRKFVLIGGMPRSGTNLLRRIIGSHSQIAIPPGEFHFFSQYKNGRTVEQILGNERLKQWNMDFAPFSSLPHGEAFIKTLTCYAENCGKEIPGEKTPLNEFYYNLIQAWLHDYDLKFLQLVRNPLDVMASYKHAPFRRGERGEGFDVPAQCRDWHRSVSLGLARSYANPTGYCLVKYEDLTVDPIASTQRACGFLGVPFEEARMLNLSDFAGHADNTSFTHTSEHSHGRYATIHQLAARKHHLTEAEREAVGRLCGELAQALGYDDVDLRPPDVETSPPGLIAKLKGIARKYAS